MTKHTPGPWVVSRGAQNHPYSIEGPAQTIALVVMQKTTEKTTGNAHVLAAAPELLEALKKVYTQLGEDLIDNKMLTVASTRKLQLFLGKAISKAEGE